MNAKKIDLLYDNMLKLPIGANRTKVDLHIHTPASKDFIFNPLSKKEAYLNILDSAIANNIDIIAITDHNTFEGIQYIRNMLKNDLELSNKYKKLCILCGIEITCFSKHILAIFPDSFDETKQNRFLYEIGIDNDLYGAEDALADNLGPSLLIRKIGENGGVFIVGTC